MPSSPLPPLSSSAICTFVLYWPPILSNLPLSPLHFSPEILYITPASLHLIFSLLFLSLYISCLPLLSSPCNSSSVLSFLLSSFLISAFSSSHYGSLYSSCFPTLFSVISSPAFCNHILSFVRFHPLFLLSSPLLPSLVFSTGLFNICFNFLLSCHFISPNLSCCLLTSSISINLFSCHIYIIHFPPFSLFYLIVCILLSLSPRLTTSFPPPLPLLPLSL